MLEMKNHSVNVKGKPCHAIEKLWYLNIDILFKTILAKGKTSSQNL